MKAWAITTILAALGVVAQPEARAAEVLRTAFSHGPANCQAALPVFDGNIRKRPKAVANEGASVAFITCDFEVARELPEQVERITIFLTNRTAQEAIVNCTAVFGIGDQTFSPAITKSLGFAPGAGLLGWIAIVDNEGTYFSYPAISCAIPPGVEISGTRVHYLMEIGN